MNKKIVIIVVFIVLIISGVFGFKNLWQAKQMPVWESDGKSATPHPVTVAPQVTTKPFDCNKIPGWKNFPEYRGNGITFCYPANWIFSEGNAGPLLTSPDKKARIYTYGPYSQNPDEIAKNAIDSENVLVNKSLIRVQGNMALQQETRRLEAAKQYKFSIDVFIGNIFTKSIEPHSGHTQIDLSTVALGIEFIDSTQQDTVNKLLSQILSTVSYTVSRPQ